MEELALLVFTICVQAAIGIMVFATLGKFLNKEAVFKPAIITAAALAAIGLVASLMHLGQPLRALNSLAHFATSWLSREIWATSIFAGLTVIAAFLLIFEPKAKGALRGLVTIAAIVGLVDVYVMTSIYTSVSVRAWQYASIYVEFYAAALSMGAVLFLTLSKKEALNMYKIAATMTGIAVVLQVAAMVTYYIQLGTSSSLAAQQSLSLLSSMSGAMMIKWLCILLGAGLLFFPMRKQASVYVSGGAASIEVAASGTETSSLGLYAAVVFLVIGQIVGRYLFYVVMVASRVGLN